MADNENVKIEEINEEETIPELEDAAQQPAETPNVEEPTSSRIDKKTRKAFARIGLSPYQETVHKVTLRQGNTNFSIAQPEVFKGTTETYIVIGEPKLEDSSESQRAAIQQLIQQQQLMSQQQQQQQPEATSEEATAEDITEGVKEEEGEAVDESNVDENDVELVLASAPQGTTRTQAIKALLAKGNPVDAVLHLSTE